MMQTFRPYILIFLAGASILSARNYASFAGGFLRMGSSARAMAMGSGFTAEIDPGFAAYHNPAWEHTQYLSTSEDALIISFAQKILPWFSAGLNLKILNHQLPMNTMDLAGKGMGMDFGVFIHPENGPNLAFMVQDLSSRYQWKT